MIYEIKVVYGNEIPIQITNNRYKYEVITSLNQNRFIDEDFTKSPHGIEEAVAIVCEAIKNNIQHIFEINGMLDYVQSIGVSLQQQNGIEYFKVKILWKK